MRMPTRRLLLGDGDAGDLVAAHDFEGVGDGLVGRDGDGVDDHAGLSERLTLSISPACCVDGEVAVDDAEAALLGHGDGEARFGDGVHGGGHQRGVERDVAGELGLRADLGGDDVAVGGDEQDIVEGKGFGDGGDDHWGSASASAPAWAWLESWVGRVGFVRL